VTGPPSKDGRCPRGVMHWLGRYLADRDEKPFLALGLSISFSGTVTSNSAAETHACARRSIRFANLIETDLHFLAPSRGGASATSQPLWFQLAERMAVFGRSPSRRWRPQ